MSYSWVWVLLISRLCVLNFALRVVVNKTKAGLLLKAKHSHTSGAFLWRILRGRWKTAPEGFVPTRVLPSFHPFFFFFCLALSFFFRLHNCTLERWMAACLPACREPPLICTGSWSSITTAEVHTQTNMAGGQSLCISVQDTHFTAWMQVNAPHTFEWPINLIHKH